MTSSIARICDMREGGALQLFREDDGDIIVSIIPEDGVVSMQSAQFCLSGTQSRRTQSALFELFKAMEADELDIPQRAGMRGKLGESHG